MKLTKTNINNIKKSTNSRLVNYVCNYILDKWSDYNNKVDIFNDVFKYGCQSGIVSSLIYYSDTTAFYKKHQEEIIELLYNTGLSPKELFGDKWDDGDTLALYGYNQNLLAWFGFEDTLYNIYNILNRD